MLFQSGDAKPLARHMGCSLELAVALEFSQVQRAFQILPPPCLPTEPWTLSSALAGVKPTIALFSATDVKPPGPAQCLSGRGPTSHIQTGVLSSRQLPMLSFSRPQYRFPRAAEIKDRNWVAKTTVTHSPTVLEAGGQNQGVSRVSAF